MFTFGFILNAEGTSPANFSGQIETDAICAYAAGTDGMEMAISYAKELAVKGVKNIDLCGDFDAEKAEAISKALDGKLKIKYAQYFPEQEAKLLTISMEKYAFILKYDSLNFAKHAIDCSVPGFTFKLVGVSGTDEAISAINGLQEEGYEFFELCSGFNADATREVIEKTGGKSAIGSAGL